MAIAELVVGMDHLTGGLRNGVLDKADPYRRLNHYLTVGTSLSDLTIAVGESRLEARLTMQDITGLLQENMRISVSCCSSLSRIFSLMLAIITLDTSLVNAFNSWAEANAKPISGMSIYFFSCWACI